MTTVDTLVRRSAPLKRQLLAFSQSKRFSRELDDALRERFGADSVADEDQLINFFDRFLLQHRLGDGRTVVERFARARGDLPRAEREMMRGWQDVVESAFEVNGIDGPALLVTNLIDELPYRVRSNMGIAFLEQFRPRSIFLGRVVPVLDEWLISGTVAPIPAKHVKRLLPVIAQQAATHPETHCRNPQHREQATQMQRDDRERFIAYYGTEVVVVPGYTLPKQAVAHMGRRRVGRLANVFPDELLDADTVGMVYDEIEGLTFYPHVGELQAVFERPELLAQDADLTEFVLSAVESDTFSPLAFRHFARTWPDNTDVVLAQVLNRPSFSWQRDGEALMRRHKPGFFGGPQKLRFTIISDRLKPYLKV